MDRCVDYTKNELLEVFWIDAFFNDDWLNEKESIERPKEVDCQSVGYFLKKDEEAIYISPSIGKDTERTLIFIPLGCIKEIKRLNAS